MGRRAEWLIEVQLSVRRALIILEDGRPVRYWITCVSCAAIMSRDFVAPSISCHFRHSHTSETIEKPALSILSNGNLEISSSHSSDMPRILGQRIFIVCLPCPASVADARIRKSMRTRKGTAETSHMNTARHHAVLSRCHPVNRLTFTCSVRFRYCKNKFTISERPSQETEIRILLIDYRRDPCNLQQAPSR